MRGHVKLGFIKGAIDRQIIPICGILDQQTTMKKEQWSFTLYLQSSSVADPGCLSRILILPIPDPGSKISYTREEWKKFVVIPFFVATNFTKFKITLFLNWWRKKFGPIKELFTQKVVTKLSKIWVWDPGSGKNLFRIPDPGVKKAPDPGSGSATLQSSMEIVLSW